MSSGQIITFYVTALALTACVVMTHQYGEDDNQEVIYLKMIPAICLAGGGIYKI